MCVHPCAGRDQKRVSDFQELELEPSDMIRSSTEVVSSVNYWAVSPDSILYFFQVLLLRGGTWSPGKQQKLAGPSYTHCCPWAHFKELAVPWCSQTQPMNFTAMLSEPHDPGPPHSSLSASLNVAPGLPITPSQGLSALASHSVLVSGGRMYGAPILFCLFVFVLTV